MPDEIKGQKGKKEGYGMLQGKAERQEVAPKVIRWAAYCSVFLGFFFCTTAEKI